MKLDVTSRGGEVTPDIQQCLEKKLKKVERVSKPTGQLNVTIVHDRPDRGVEVSARAYGQDFRAKEQGEDLVVCAESALDKLFKQIKKRKEKVTDYSPHS